MKWELLYTIYLTIKINSQSNFFFFHELELISSLALFAIFFSFESTIALIRYTTPYLRRVPPEGQENE